VCPFCAEPIEQLPAAEVMGLKLVAIDALTEPVALAVSLPPPTPRP
jgi:hypothetical protein